MAIAYKSRGAGVVTEASGGALTPLCPATVDAGDILIAHCAYEGTSTTPSTPSNWTLLGGPYTVESAYRHWIFGKVADGTEDGAGGCAFGTPAVTTLRVARIYSFSGRVAGNIDQLVTPGSFAHLSHGTDPAFPDVTTTKAGALAVACLFQADDNPQADVTGESGGAWAEHVVDGEYVQAATTPDTCLHMYTCTPTANPGTVTGGVCATLNDPVGVIGFQIRDDVVATASSADPGSYSLTGVAATATKAIPSNAESGSYSITGVDATGVVDVAEQHIASNAEPGAIAITGSGATANVAVPSNTEPGALAVTGADAAAVVAVPSNAEPGAVSVSGADATDAQVLGSNAEPGALAITGADAADVVEKQSNAEPGAVAITGVDAAGAVAIPSNAEPGAVAITGADATANVAVPSNAAPGAYEVTGVDATGVVDAGGPVAHQSNAEPGAYEVTGSDATAAVEVFEEGGGGSLDHRKKRRPALAGLPKIPQTKPVDVTPPPPARVVARAKLHLDDWVGRVDAHVRAHMFARHVAGEVYKIIPRARMNLRARLVAPVRAAVPHLRPAALYVEERALAESLLLGDDGTSRWYVTAQDSRNDKEPT